MVPFGETHDPARWYLIREQSVETANTALDMAIEHIRAYAPDFLREVDLSRIQALLPDENTALIAFCITDQGSESFVVQRGSAIRIIETSTFTRGELRRLFAVWDTAGAAIGGWLGAYMHQLAENTSVTAARWQETITNVLEHLGKHLLNPILSTLPPTIERIIFLPYAELFLFPLHAAPLADGTSDQVCYRFQVSYTPSLKVLSEAQAKGLWETTPELYAVINPCADSKLVFAWTEGSVLARFFAKRTIDLGPQGTKKHVVAGMQKQAYVHFACHGSYDWNDPTASGLELADGRLTLAQLQHGEVDLSTTRLVTLSACETGITDVVGSNAEEFVGVPAGFLLAGVPCVVSSLWAVFDLSTTLLMERFYLNHLISRLDFAAALREAQLWVRNLGIQEVANHVEQWYRQAPQRDKSELFKWARHYRYLATTNSNLCPFEHPYYWAAFTVNGS